MTSRFHGGHRSTPIPEALTELMSYGNASGMPVDAPADSP